MVLGGARVGAPEGKSLNHSRMNEKLSQLLVGLSKLEMIGHLMSSTTPIRQCHLVEHICQVLLGVILLLDTASLRRVRLLPMFPGFAYNLQGNQPRFDAS